jgi:hypothetical protein
MPQSAADALDPVANTILKNSMISSREKRLRFRLQTFYYLKNVLFVNIDL